MAVENGGNSGHAGHAILRQQDPLFDLRQCENVRALMALNELLLDDNNRETQFVSAQFITPLLFVCNFL